MSLKCSQISLDVYMCDINLAEYVQCVYMCGQCLRDWLMNDQSISDMCTYI